MINDSNRFGSTNIKDIESFEAKYAIALPKEYKEFLLEYNGGAPTPSTNKIPETDVQWLYGIHNGENWASLEWNIETLKNRIPENTLPIAGDSLGNSFLLSLNNDTYGEIWFWDHELEGEEGESYFGNITKSANSFNDFIGNLYEYIPNDEPETDRIIRTNDIKGLISLLDKGYNVNTEDEYKRTLLENAAIHNKIELAKILIDRKAEKRNSLQLALQNQEAFPTHGYDDIVKLLKNYKPSLWHSFASIFGKFAK